MKNPAYRFAIFDFDGTLADTTHVILSTLKATFEAMALAPKSEEEYRSIIGLPLVECFKQLVPTLSAEQAQQCATTYQKLFPTYDTQDAVQLYPYVADTLNTLHQAGIKIAIASSRNHHSLKKYVHQFHLEQIVVSYIGADDVEHGKPNPEPVEKLMQQWGFRAEETIVIGDAPYDILMGNHAHCTTCGVTYGNGKKEDLLTAQADIIIDHFDELLAFIFFHKN